MSPLRSSAPSGPAQARRRRLGAATVAVAVLLAVLLGVRTADDPGVPLAEPTATTSAQPSPASTASTPTPARSGPTLPAYASSGRYTRMRTGTPVRGTSGRLVTYRVEVEQGAGVTTREFADAVDATLQHPRGWTAGGHWRFQRVVRAHPSLTIRLATPDTVDQACAAAGADTDGYTSCRAGDLIMLNLDRWHVGVPHVPSLTGYRHYLVNHEVGHGLGLGHQGCTGAGRTAPVMLQQTLGLRGCRPNPWPRSQSGRLVTGPSL
ncbi:DUF3152 domain-containing protein [Janibacter terrae]|uniref:DUF3152 domain-containing protein n=1 Tax=Janibacter terrae TaxID=103817 RepID=UPI0031F89323|nr:hypothetical protein [Kytococcus sp.]